MQRLLIFVIGLVTGIAVCAAWLAVQDSDTGSPQRAAAPDVPATARQPSTVAATTASRDEQSEAQQRTSSSSPPARSQAINPPTPAITSTPTVRPASDERRGLPRIDAPPIAVPEALRNMLEEQPVSAPESMTMPEAHRTIEAETKDPDWAYALEQSLRQFFANHVHGPNFDIWLIECRRTMCEIQGAGYSPEAAAELRALLQALRAQPWMTPFTGTWSASHNEDGILYFAFIVQATAELRS